MSNDTWLSDLELQDATRRQYPAVQARVLQEWHVPFKRRPDGTLMVSRAALDAILQGRSETTQSKPANGLNWSKRA